MDLLNPWGAVARFQGAAALQNSTALVKAFPLQIPISSIPNLASVSSSKPQQLHRRNHQCACLSSSSSSFSSSSANASGGVFPGGTRRASVRLPGLGLRLKTDAVLGNVPVLKAMLDSAVAAGLNLVLLEDGKEDSLRLYEAAQIVMSVLRGRADLLVFDRVDIAAAVGANGVVLSDRGLPSVVARRMMQNAMPEAVVLPLIARRVTSAESAESATVIEGADMLMLQVDGLAGAENLVENICKRVKIPVFLEWSSSLQDVGLESPAFKFLEVGASGIILDSLPTTGKVTTYVADLVSKIGLTLQSRGPKALKVNGDGASNRGRELWSLEEQAKQIIEEERPILTFAAEVIQEASPEMQEVSLLVDTIKQLDDLFLLVVVGEFNSGKSSVINALLGDEFLKQGVLPTTNEITLLKFSDESYEERPKRHPDGHLMRYLSAELLKQMNLVDTPGTNVILQRQQKLTEEFVPRADLVMFVIGAERPLTESEVSFLRYIRRWDKKIIFALNKCDLLSKQSEVEEVKGFVKDNVRRLLNIEEALIFPISARNALRSKTKAMTVSKRIDKDLLEGDRLWKLSGFENLEQYVLDFLGGSSEAGAERIRLKLETPLGIAVTLFSACQKRVQADGVKVEADRRALNEVEDQLERYKELMASNVEIQIQRVIACVAGASSRALRFIDRSLQVTSVDTASKYLLSQQSSAGAAQTVFESEIIGSALSDAKRAIDDHRLWVTSNTQRQLEKYKEIGKSRWPGTVVVQDFDYQLENLSNRSVDTLNGFDVKAANVLLEQELREVVFNTFGSLGIAGASASFLTSVLPTTLEDLIALGLCSAGGLLSIFKLPSLREDVKRKIERVADSLAQQLEESMRQELAESIQRVEECVEQLTAPYRAQVEAEAARLAAVERKLLIVDDQMQALRQKIRNIGSVKSEPARADRR